jgi:hypothetical protein
MKVKLQQSRFVLAIALAASASACAARSGLTGGTQVVKTQRIDGPYVLAGTEFDVEFEQPLAADTAQAGDAFVARVVTPLKAPNGRDVVVPAGARLKGTVIESIAVGGSALALSFDSLETVRGPGVLHAKVQSARPYARVALVPAAVPRSEAEQIDALLRPFPTAIGGGPPEPGEPQILVPVHIPARGRVHLALMQPLIPPDVRVEVPPQDLPKPQYFEPPYRSNLPVPANPLDLVNP